MKGNRKQDWAQEEFNLQGGPNKTSASPVGALGWIMLVRAANIEPKWLSFFAPFPYLVTRYRLPWKGCGFEKGGSLQFKWVLKEMTAGAAR